MTKDLTIQYHTEHYILETMAPNRLINKAVEVIEGYDRRLIIKWQVKEIKYSLWKERADERPKIRCPKEVEDFLSPIRNRKPSKRHSWR